MSYAGGSIHQEYITIINIYAPNIGAPKYIKQVLIDQKRYCNAVTGEDFNTSTFSSAQTIHQKTSTALQTKRAPLQSLPLTSSRNAMWKDQHAGPQNQLQQILEN
jgi:hypothetical protein